eukprot:CAMPEP_0197622662 /NCGR_PEP_ID=MMETSP1338-20131121/2870_1 /TAXON_ID=43686 ORGANISM="Pelagodinium beii, Strain RCC1491" /NCGR_SAMPLE_ID=MMETSP1338 /ASSEMBLY_ACC=CAM_ASM_000754 /LENGTH=196 /DNA_ID=CAMNT_0043192409 /DNA_START=74 /DNA_END=664 /DNA_ORIENTATION=-
MAKFAIEQEVELLPTDEESVAGVEPQVASRTPLSKYLVVGAGLGLAVVAGIFAFVNKDALTTKSQDLRSGIEEKALDFSDAMEFKYPDYQWTSQGLGSVCKFADEKVVERLTTVMTRDCQRNCMDFAEKLRKAQPDKGWWCAGVNYQVGYGLQCTSYFRPVIDVSTVFTTDAGDAADNHGSNWHQCYLFEKKTAAR